MNTKSLLFSPALLLLFLSIPLFGHYMSLGLSLTNAQPFLRTMQQAPPEKELNLLLTDVAWFPKGSAIEHLYGGGVQLTAPRGWVYIGVDKRKGKVHAISGKNVLELACRCAERSACASYVRQSEHFCHKKGGCTECEKLVKARGKDVITGRHVEFEVQKGGFVNLDRGVGFEAMSQALPMAFSEMLAYPKIVKSVEQFLADSGLEKLANHAYSKGESCRYFALNIFGRRGILAIPEAMLKNNVAAMLAQSELANSDKACLCHCVSGECSLKSLMGILFCENSGQSQDCTLKNKDANNSFAKAMQARVYRY